jgi:hypothetical protein
MRSGLYSVVSAGFAKAVIEKIAIPPISEHTVPGVKMIKILLALLLVILPVAGFCTEAKISSLAIGVYRPSEKAMLAPAFINAVNGYLARYEPRLIERGLSHVKMMVDYDFDYAVELRVNDHEYEITVTLEQETSRHSKAQKQAAKLVSGVHKVMANSLMRDARARGNASQ